MTAFGPGFPRTIDNRTTVLRIAEQGESAHQSGVTGSPV